MTFFNVSDELFEDRVIANSIFCEGFIDADNFLVDDTSGADILVSDFAIAHNSFREADIETAGADFGARPIVAKHVCARCMC